MDKPFHLIGLELSISVLSVALRGEATGTTRDWRGDAVAVAKRPLKAGERLDGEGGWTVYAKAQPATISTRDRLLPIGLAHDVTLMRDVAQGEMLKMDDVALDSAQRGVVLRQQMLA